MNPLLKVDFYKIHHYPMYPEFMTKLYSNLTPRKSRIKGINKVAVFGIQHFIKEYLIEDFNENFFAVPKEEMLTEYKRHCPVDTKHIEALWDLGYLPIEIKALPEGSLCPIGVPCLTITNTHKDFGWLVNYLETLLSCSLWQGITSATIAHEYRKLLNRYAIETTGSTDGVQWQGHDFAMRGMGSFETAVLSGMGHLLSFTGTDVIPAIYQLEKSYDAEGLIGASVPATEHSVMCMGKKESELETFKRLLDLYKTGILSVVSDTWDLWLVCTFILPKLKEEIFSRDGKLVIRPDSGDPVDILCGTVSKKTYPDLSENYHYDDSPINHPDFFEDILLDEVRAETPHGVYGAEEKELSYQINGKLYNAKIHNVQWNRYDKQYYYIDMYDEAKITVTEVEIKPEHKGVIELLWDVFGGTVNEQGYKVLDPHIGAIYGDSITLDRAEQICERLKAKGFASTNVVLGIGSYTYQYNTRDTFGFAVKATYGEVKGVGREIFKDPITDDGTKKSAKGLLCVKEVFDVNPINNKMTHKTYELHDQVSKEEEQTGALEVVFRDGKLIKSYTLEEIRQRLSLNPF